jgi:sugar phosphate isomerase/epimerase
MKIFSVFFQACVVAALPAVVSAAQPQAASDGFYAYCIEMGVPGLKPRPLAEQASLLRELGYAGTGCELGNSTAVTATLQTLDEHGLALYLVWTSINIDPAKGPAFRPALRDALRALQDRPVTVCVLLDGFSPGDPAGIQPAVGALRELGDLAAESNLCISIYNHVGNWAESLPFIVDVVRRADHPQVGFNFNLCHWLKVDGARDYRPLLREHADKLFVVTINGASTGAAAWTNGLIRPLDEGDFDNRQLLATLREIGYRGPIGLMCYGVPGDARQHLARSMRAWRGLQPARSGHTD